MPEQTIKDQTGFTLIEMLIAMAIFAVVVLIAADIFLASSRSQRKVIQIQKVHSDARFALETMAREARMGTIDYDYYGGTISGAQEELALRDIDNTLIVFKRAKDSKCPVEGTYCLQVGLDSDDSNSIESDEWVSITPRDVEVMKLWFYINPPQSPYNFNSGGIYLSNDQPRVTIVFTNRSSQPAIGAVQPEIIYLQTTVASRIYRR